MITLTEGKLIFLKHGSWEVWTKENKFVVLFLINWKTGYQNVK